MNYDSPFRSQDGENLEYKSICENLRILGDKEEEYVKMELDLMKFPFKLICLRL